MTIRTFTTVEAESMLCPVTSEEFLSSCKGMDCMMWQWEHAFFRRLRRKAGEPLEYEKTLQLERGELPEPERPGDMPASWQFCTDVDDDFCPYWLEDDASYRAREKEKRPGYCGLCARKEVRHDD